MSRTILMSVLILSVANLIIFPSSHENSSSQVMSLKNAYAQYSDPVSNSSDNSTDSGSLPQDNSTDSGSVSQNDSIDLNQTENENTLSENTTINQQSSNEYDQNKMGENQSSGNQQEIDEANNENNNEKATHQEDQQDADNIQSAIENKTVAAEVDIGAGNEEIKSIDNNIDVSVSNSTSDEVSVKVDSKSESGPKVIILNLNSTIINVANVKYLHIMYDGHSIAPATDLNALLHPKSTDEPSYAIVVTQNGAQVFVSIPHFSTHTITLSNISKVSTIPEFPLSSIMVFVLMIALMISITRKKIHFTKI